jgi:hypothetical protein
MLCGSFYAIESLMAPFFLEQTGREIKYLTVGSISFFSSFTHLSGPYFTGNMPEIFNIIRMLTGI